MTVIGEIDLASIAEFRRRLRVVATEGTQLVVDLRRVDLIDSLGLGALVGARRRVGTDGQVVVVANPGPVANLIQRCGLSELLAMSVD
jgi:anti-anti-sigma factor